jgi:hypothetical protein
MKHFPFEKSAKGKRNPLDLKEDCIRPTYSDAADTNFWRYEEDHSSKFLVGCMAGPMLRLGIVLLYEPVPWVRG